jgi:hypothetical protein
MSELQSTYFYREPRLHMTIAGRFIVRLLTYGAYGVAAIVGLIAWGSNVPELHAVGSLTFLFLFSRLFAINKPERSLAQLTPRHPNIAVYMAPDSYHIIEAATDKVALHGGDIRLYILKMLVERPEIKQVLIRLDVDAAAFLHKTEQYIQESRARVRSREQMMQDIDGLVMAAFGKAKNNYGRAISPHYLFGAFGGVEEEHIKRLFTLFNVTTEDVEIAFLFGKRRKSSLSKFSTKPFKQKHQIINRA